MYRPPPWQDSRWLAAWFLVLAVVGGVAVPSIIEGEPTLSLITVGMTVAFVVLFAGWPLLASFASARQAERANQRVAAGQAATTAGTEAGDRLFPTASPQPWPRS